MLLCKKKVRQEVDLQKVLVYKPEPHGVSYTEGEITEVKKGTQMEVKEELRTLKHQRGCRTLFLKVRMDLKGQQLWVCVFELLEICMYFDVVLIFTPHSSSAEFYLSLILNLVIFKILVQWFEIVLFMVVEALNKCICYFLTLIYHTNGC